MMTLIIGGSGSGKSAYAEDYINSLSNKKKKYYIATMQAFDLEGQEKVKRHQMLRSGKGFYTIEQPVDIQDAVQKMDECEKTALLECISNLAANEMFAGGLPKQAAIVADGIIDGITVLEKALTHLVIVSNNVFEDGRTYDKTTMEYIEVMGQINKQLADMADEVIEVVVGIPVIVKSGNDS